MVHIMTVTRRTNILISPPKYLLCFSSWRSQEIDMDKSWTTTNAGRRLQHSVINFQLEDKRVLTALPKKLRDTSP